MNDIIYLCEDKFCWLENYLYYKEVRVRCRKAENRNSEKSGIQSHCELYRKLYLCEKQLVL